MNVETVITLIATIGGLSGLISAISTTIFKIIDYKKAQRGESLEAKLEEKLRPLIESQEVTRQENAGLRAEIHEIRLDTLRTQLYIKMEHEPHNHDTILTIAHKYFVEYHGDWVATTDFQRWADKEQIKIPSAIMGAIAQNDGK